MPTRVVALAALVVPLLVTNRLWLLAVEVFFVASILVRSAGL